MGLVEEQHWNMGEHKGVSGRLIHYPQVPHFPDVK